MVSPPVGHLHIELTSVPSSPTADKIVTKDGSVDVFAKPFIRVTRPGSSSGEADILQKFEAERRLIALVRRQPALYDARHPKFHDDVHREKLWQGVASRLDTDLTNCLAAWAELRYRYQRHRKFKERTPVTHEVAGQNTTLTK